MRLYRKFGGKENVFAKTRTKQIIISEATAITIILSIFILNLTHRKSIDHIAQHFVLVVHYTSITIIIFPFRYRIFLKTIHFVPGNIVCYYLSTNAYKNTRPDELNPQLCTHIVYAFVSLAENGSLIVQNENLDIKFGK